MSSRRFIAAVQAHNTPGILSTSSDGRRIIAMSLYGRNPRHTWGVIRNAQLVPVHFPGWRLRVYVPSVSDNSMNITVPQRFIDKLKLLGAEIARVEGRVGNRTELSPRDWRLLVADDRKVDYFLIRDADSRLSDRDASAVQEWIDEVQRRAGVGDRDAFPVHCIRDHPKHAEWTVVDGLWGGRPGALRRRLGTRLSTALYRKLSPTLNVTADSVVSTTVNGISSATVAQVYRPTSTLEELLWPVIGGNPAALLCHDVVSPCDRWTTSAKSSVGESGSSTMSRRRFPVPRKGSECVGCFHNLPIVDPVNYVSTQNIVTCTAIMVRMPLRAVGEEAIHSDVLNSVHVVVFGNWEVQKSTNYSGPLLWVKN